MKEKKAVKLRVGKMRGTGGKKGRETHVIQFYLTDINNILL